MLPASSGADVYRRLHIESRTPLELVVILYDAALGRVADARAAMDRDDRSAQRDAIGRALAIVAELQNRLDMRGGGEIATRLDGLYSFVMTALMDASARGNSAALEGVETVLSTLRDAWSEISGRGPSDVS